MTKLKNKILLLSLTLVVITVSGVLALSASSLVRDKEETVKEMSAVLLPSVVASIEKDLLSLKIDVIRAASEALQTQSGSEASQQMDSSFKSISDLVALRVYKDEQEILNVSFGDVLPPVDFNAITPKGALMVLHNNRDLTLRQLSFIDGDKLYEVFFKPERIFNMLRTNRAMSMFVFNCETGESTSQGDNPGSWFDEFACSKDSTQNQQVAVLKNGDMLWSVAPFSSMHDNVLVGSIPVAQARSLAEAIFREIWIFAIGILIFAAAASFMLSKKIAGPIEKLVAATARISKGEWKTNLPVRGKDEISNLVKAFNQMGRELEDRENTLKETHRELIRTEKLATLGKFSAGMAHEMKNPLNSVMNFSELLLRTNTVVENPQVKEGVEFIFQEAKRVNGIISDLMSFSRQRPAAKLKTDVGEIVSHVSKLQGPEAIKRGVNLSVTLPQTPVYCEGDREQLLQVFLNLVTNAFHAVESSGRKEVSMSVIPDGQNISVTVKDSGVGISEENLVKVFDPFFTTKGIGKGTGLGLAICYGIIKEHGGHVKVDSAVGQGTAFVIVLPAVA